MSRFGALLLALALNATARGCSRTIPVSSRVSSSAISRRCTGP